jgi:hypothetical protein
MSDASHGKAGRLGSKGNDTEFEVRPSFDEAWPVRAQASEPRPGRPSRQIGAVILACP